MAHWAELDGNNVVLRVTVGDNSDTDEGFSWLVANLGGHWVKTSYNTRGGVHYEPDGEPSADQSKAYRYNYAGLGWSYDPNFGSDGAFIPPQPFPSWVLNPDTALWDAPTPMPAEGGPWSWDEDTLSWVGVSAQPE